VRFVFGAISILAAHTWALPAFAAASPADALGKLSYDVAWRLIHAGDVVIEPKESEGRIKIDSAGLVSTLFKIDNTYTVHYAPSFCATDSLLDSKEGKRHHQTSVAFDRSQNRAVFVERDLLKNEILKSAQTEIPSCVHDVLGGILALRGLTLEPGQSTQLPMSDGRRAAQVKVEAQEREEVTTPAGKFKTIRYEANLMNGVVYARKGRVFVWLTDDAKKTPVQILLRLSFPIGTVTLQLEKEESK
jgi:hypothetical protein